MKKKPSFVDHSRGSWHPAPDAERPDTTQIATGCLQRIADSLEHIAINSKQDAYLRSENVRLEKVARTLRSKIKKLQEIK